MKVALSGLGGDELFAGYPSFTDVPRIRRFAHCHGRVAGIRRAGAQGRVPAAAPVHLAEVRGPGSNTAEATPARTCCGAACSLPWELPQVMDPEFAARGWEDLRSLHSLEESSRGLAERAGHSFRP